VSLLLIIVGLIFVNGLFVMAEMALVSARKGRLQARAERGDKSARAALALMEHPNRYLSATQLGITLATIVLGMYGEASLTEVLRGWFAEVSWVGRNAHVVATAVTVMVLTFATLLLAELVPKRLGQLYPEALARLVARPMSLLSWLTAPLITVLSGLTNVILKLVPEPAVDEEVAAQEEVKAILASGAEMGTVHQSEQLLVERVFQLGEQRVRSLMVPRNDIDFLDVGDTAQRVRVAVATSAHSHFPVCDGDLDHLVGVVHVKDVVKHGLISDELDLRALCRKPYFVPESATALKVLEQFKNRSTHLAFVLDEYGALVGLVTLNDLVESMLGEITMSDPGGAGAPEPLIVKRHEGSYLLDAMLPVAELKRVMGTHELPRESDGGFDTLGGFVMSYLGRVPAIGDRFSFERYTFEVVDMDRTRVDRVMLDIEPVVEEGAGEEVRR
jgi:putative hemolysin